MEAKNRRSSLRKSVVEPNGIKTQVKRRISFSGKKSVRIFHGEEEPKTWNNSYEISDHLNVNETASNLCAHTNVTKTPQSILKNTFENKENVDSSYIINPEAQMYANQNCKYESISNNVSVLSTTKDLINTSYQHQNSKMYQIENSVDITLYDREMKLVVADNKLSEQTKSNSYSFSLDENEKEIGSVMFGEKTIDFMGAIRSDASNIRDDYTNAKNFKNNNGVTFSEYSEENQYLDFKITEDKIAKESVTIYMNDSLSTSHHDHISDGHGKLNKKRKTMLQPTAMELSPNKIKQNDKENINPTIMRNLNKSQNESCEMEIEEVIFSQPQSIRVNVERESTVFEEKLNQLSLLQDSDDNMEIEKSARLGNVKSKPSINFNEAIELSPKNTDSNSNSKKINSRSTINFNQMIEISPKRNKQNSIINIPSNSRQTVHVNKTIEFSPKNIDNKSNNIKPRPTINFNQSIEVDSEKPIVDQEIHHGAIPKIKQSSTINFNQSINANSPQKNILHVPRKTINLNEDIFCSPKLSQEPVCSNNLNVPEGIHKHDQQHKLVVRKICSQIVNKTKNPIHLKQQYMQRYKKKLEQNVGAVKAASYDEVPVPETKNFSKSDKSLDLLLDIGENMLLSPESSSPLLQSEFKVYNFKQLNDELDHGKINIFSNVSKTPSTDRKSRLTASKIHANNEYKQRTLVFNDVDILATSDDTLKSNNYFDSNTAQHVIPQKTKSNVKCLNSQADDISVDNISFPEKDNDIMDVYTESLRDVNASILDMDIVDSSAKSKKLCNKEKFIQNDAMDISYENKTCNVEKHEEEFDEGNLHQSKTVIFNQDIESFENSLGNNKNSNTSDEKKSNICENNEMEIDDELVKTIEIQQVEVEKGTRQTIYLNNDIEEQYPSNEMKTIRKTLLLNEVIDPDYNNFDSNCAIQSANLNKDKSKSIEHDKNYNNLKDGFASVVDINPIEPTMECESEFINMQNYGGYNSYKRKTLYPNDDIAEEILSEGVKYSFNEFDNTNQLGKGKLQSRLTTYFDNDNIIDENSVMYKPCDNFKNVKEQKECISDLEINNNESVAKPASTSTRITQYFNNEIEKNDVNEISNRNHTRKTLYFNGEISIEDVSIRIDDNIPLPEKSNTDVLNLNSSRKTIFFSNKIPLEEVSINAKAQCCEIAGENIDTLKSSRKTVFFNNEIQLEKAIVKRSNKDTTNSSPTRKTKLYNNSICDLDEIKVHTLGEKLYNKTSKCRKSIHVAQDMDMTMNAEIPVNDEREQLMAFEAIESKNDDEQKEDSNKTELKSNRKNIYTAEFMDLSLLEKQLPNKGTEKEREVLAKSDTFHNTECIMDISLDRNLHTETDKQKREEILKKGNDLSLCENNNAKPVNRKTLVFNDNNDMSLDQFFTPGEDYQFPEPLEPLNAAKITLSRYISNNNLTNKKTQIKNKQRDALMTPLKFINSNQRSFHMTPRLSLLEFEKEEERLENSNDSPRMRENTNKRLPMNLTPILTIPKKRQTLKYDDNLIDETHISPPAENSPNKNVTRPNEKENNCEESIPESDRAENENVNESNSIVGNDFIPQTPSKERKSRIPIPISSGKKSNKSFSPFHTSADLHKEADVQLDIEGDNLSESIQPMRKATTFIQRRDTDTEIRKNVDLRVDTLRKSSIFEGNPITISDVSVYFDVQRKSNSVDPETKMVSALEKINMCEKNCFTNLSLEDIEKTRLSLVTISYEERSENNTVELDQEQDDNSAKSQLLQNGVVSSDECVESNQDFKNKRQSVNYLRNVSALCRKCKRCQETILNETISSPSESFVLPELLPLPNLNLEHLRRLRKRPIIADVTALWQRVSLERTIINPMNIFDEDSQMISDIDDKEAVDDNSLAIKCIRKYEKNMLSFKMDFLGKQPTETPLEKVSFVSRLDDLISKNSTNWMFDFQMQYRGILLFTHTKMITFSVALRFDEVDPLGQEINVKSVKLEKSHIPEKNWKAIDFVLDFQFKINLPFDLQSLCEGSNEADVFKMLLAIDRVCLDTVKMGNHLQRISFINQASIARDQFRTYVKKIIRKIVQSNDSDFKYVEKTEIKVELLNLNKLSFRDIVSPPLHHFREEIQLLPTGIQFLQEFLENPLNYVKYH